MEQSSPSAPDYVEELWKVLHEILLCYHKVVIVGFGRIEENLRIEALSKQTKTFVFERFIWGRHPTLMNLTSTVGFIFDSFYSLIFFVQKRLSLSFEDGYILRKALPDHKPLKSHGCPHNVFIANRKFVIQCPVTSVLLTLFFLY